MEFLFFSISYISLGILIHYIFTSYVSSRKKLTFNRLVGTAALLLFLVIGILTAYGYWKNQTEFFKYNLGDMIILLGTTLLAYVAIAQKMKEQDVENILPVLENNHIPIIEDLNQMKRHINDFKEEYIYFTHDAKWEKISEIKKSIMFEDFKASINSIYLHMKEYSSVLSPARKKTIEMTNDSFQRLYNDLFSHHMLKKMDGFSNFSFIYYVLDEKRSPPFIKPLLLNQNPLDTIKIMDDDYDDNIAHIKVTLLEERGGGLAEVGENDIMLSKIRDNLYKMFEDLLHDFDADQNFITLRKLTKELNVEIDNVNKDLNKIIDRYRELFSII